MKKFFITLLIATTLYSSVAFGSTTEVGKLDTSINNILYSSQEKDDFNSKVANGKSYVDLVVEYKYRKEKKLDNNEIKKFVETNNEKISASESIKVYGIKNIKAKDLYNMYETNSSLSDLISKNHGLITLYKNKNNEFISSIFYQDEKELKKDIKPIKVINSDKGEPVTYKDYIPEYKSINGWVAMGSGSLVANDDVVKMLSNKKELLELLKSSGMKNPHSLKVLAGIRYVGPCLYFIEDNEEFLMPLESGQATNLNQYSVYRAKDVLLQIKDQLIKEDNEIEDLNNMTPEMLKDMKIGGPLSEVPKFNKIEAVNLATLTSGSSNTDISSKNGNKLIVYSALGLTLIGSIILAKKTKLIKYNK